MGIRIDGRFSAGAADGFVADAENIAAKENGKEITLEQKLDNLLNKAKDYADAVLEALKLIEIGPRPEKGSTNKIYLEPKTNNEENDLFDEYLWVNDKWEFVGTKKLDANLSDYVKNNEEGWATQAKAGIVQINPNKGIGRANLSAALEIVPATDAEIDAKTNYSKPIVPARLNRAVKSAITGNDSTLTENERRAAHKWLGINNVINDGGPIPSITLTVLYQADAGAYLTLHLTGVNKIDWGDGTKTDYAESDLNSKSHNYSNVSDGERLIIQIYGPTSIDDYAFSDMEHDLLHVCVGKQITRVGRRIMVPADALEYTFTEIQFLSEFPPRISEVIYSQVTGGHPVAVDSLYPTFSQDTGDTPDVAKIIVPSGALELYKYYWKHLYDNRLVSNAALYHVTGTVCDENLTPIAKFDGYTTNLVGLGTNKPFKNLYFSKQTSLNVSLLEASVEQEYVPLHIAFDGEEPVLVLMPTDTKKDRMTIRKNLYMSGVTYATVR